MGKFDKYKGSNPSSRLPEARNKSGAVRTSGDERRAQYIAKAQEARAAGRKPGLSRAGQFVIALDATGSMMSLIDGARQNITTILNRIYEEAGTNVQIRVYVYRDYDVPQFLCEASPMTDDANELARWLAGVKITGGGGNDGEAIEAVLEAADEAGEASAILLAGDEPSNPRHDIDAQGLHNTVTAHDWAKRFGEKGVPIHTFAVGDDSRTISDFKTIAQLSGGQAGRLDGSTAMIDMAVMAMLSSLKGLDSVRRYMDRHALTDSARKFGTLLLTGPRSDIP